MICSWFEQIALKNRAIRSNKTYFLYFFDSFSQFSPFLWQKSKGLPLLFAQSLFLKSDESNSLSLLFTKERPWVIRSGTSWQKSNWSDSLFFTSESLFSRANRSFALKKRAIRLKNWWATQPWVRVLKNFSTLKTTTYVIPGWFILLVN